jgi:hypothetical protein
MLLGMEEIYNQKLLDEEFKFALIGFSKSEAEEKKKLDDLRAAQANGAHVHALNAQFLKDALKVT